MESVQVLTIHCSQGAPSNDHLPKVWTKRELREKKGLVLIVVKRTIYILNPWLHIRSYRKKRKEKNSGHIKTLPLFFSSCAEASLFARASTLPILTCHWLQRVTGPWCLPSKTLKTPLQLINQAHCFTKTKLTNPLHTM